jgi:uncharacterized protein YebE (UPF0316 family)
MRRFCLYLLLLFAFSIPWQNAISIGGTRTLSMYLGIAAIGATVVSCLIERRVAKPSWFFLAVLLLVLWEVTTYFWSLDADWTVLTLQTLGQLVGMVWLVGELCAEENEKHAVMQAFVFGCWVVCFVLISAYLSGQAMDAYRYAPEDFSLNGAADTLALGIAMALILIVKLKSRVFFWMNVCYIPIAVFSVVLTASRSGFIATCLACAGVVFVLRRARLVLRVGWTILIVGLCVALFVGLASEERLAANMSRIVMTSETYSVSTLSGRTDIWAAGYDVFVRHPFVGVGSGAFRVAVADQFGADLPAHNLFIQVAVETGIVGLLLLAGVLAASVVPSLRRGNTVGLNAILFLVAMVMAGVANVQANKAFWLVLTLLAVGTRSVLPSTVSQGEEGSPQVMAS